ncbi:ExbD/TolR family protein [Pseudomonas sp. LRF_L74]|uniref:ExbD/TolR family protein n=1 Tax=Pseudomonas sp. LRF_L74 TaxID=3369422 RepID=UPI003F6033A9
MKFRRRAGNVAREEVFLNLTSMIDVIFVLLLFFVVTTTFSRPTQLKIDLPEAASGEPNEAQANPLELSIDETGQYAVNGKVLVKNDLESLTNVLQQESNGDTSMPLIISADAKTTHQSVVTAMDAAGKLGFSHLRMTTVESSAGK